MQAISKRLQEGEKMPLTRQVYSDILKNEGIGGFWQGIQPNIARNCMINIGEMASYDQYKQLFLTYTPIRDGAFLHFLCGAASGFTATCIGSPFDVVKTRLMSDPHAYPGVVSAFTTMAKQEGLMVFYQGFIPNFVRLCSWTIVMFMSMEQIKTMLYRNVH
jgi:solute carrier family 25 uncoupling protein 8/9